VMSSELAEAVHNAAEAAADFAYSAGLDEDKCINLYNVAAAAAAKTLDPTCNADKCDMSEFQTVEEGAPESRHSTRGSSRIEQILARSIKKNAVRAVDLFKEWDEDRNGVLSKKEFRKALKASGIQAESADIDALFDKWDKDGSGTIDFNELNKALKKGIAFLKEELEREDRGDKEKKEDDGETITLLGRGDKAAAVKQAKEEKVKAKERREMLSPRSQQLKEAAEKAEQQVHATRAGRLSASRRGRAAPLHLAGLIGLVARAAPLARA